MICAPISGVTFISVPGMVVAKGYSYLQMCLGFIVGYLIIAFVLLPIYYRQRVVSIYSFLGNRFGKSTYKTGACFFLISKISGTAVKLFVICTVLQVLVFDVIGLPFPVTVLITLALVFLYTAKGGVKAVVWVDMLKCVCLIISVCVCIFCITNFLGLGFDDIGDIVSNHHTSYIFNFSEPEKESYFWKQFIAGIFLVVAMTGLDQDMMQHPLACRNATQSMKNMLVSSIMQFIVITMFLVLGSLLIIYAEQQNVTLPTKSDNLFATIAFDDHLPGIVGIFFILGLVSATYSSVGSALTSLTTSYTLDIKGFDSLQDSYTLTRHRLRAHASMTLVLATVIIVFYYMSNQDAISTIFMLASYTYGPLLGLFIFGLLCHRKVDDRMTPVVCIITPILCLLLQWLCRRYLEYEIGFELLIINTAITLTGLCLVGLMTRQDTYYEVEERKEEL